MTEQGNIQELVIYSKGGRGYWTGARWASIEEAKVFNSSDDARAEMWKKEIRYTYNVLPKGWKIRPHKGGRSISKRTDVTPVSARKLAALRRDHQISLGDIVAEAVEKKWNELYRTNDVRSQAGADFGGME